MELPVTTAGIDQFRALWPALDGRRLPLRSDRLTFSLRCRSWLLSHAMQTSQVTRLRCHGECRAYFTGPPRAREARDERDEIRPFRRNAGGLLAIGECGQVCLHSSYLFQKFQRIESADNLAQLGFCRLRDTLRLQESLTGRLRRMVALEDLCSLTMLCSQFERGLKEVHEQPRGTIQARDRLGGSNALEAPIAQKLAHDGAVFLLDPGLVVLAIWARAGELDPPAQAVLDQIVVHKLAAIVDIQLAKDKRPADSDALERFNHEVAFAHDKRRGFRPTAGNIGQNKAVDITATVNLATMGDQVHFHAARERLIPIGKGAQRHTPTRFRLHPTARLRARRTARRAQQSVDCRRTHREDLRANRFIELQMSVALQSGQQN